MLVQEGGSIIVAGKVMQHIALAGKRFPVNHRTSSQTIELKKIEDAGVERKWNRSKNQSEPKVCTPPQTNETVSLFEVWTRCGRRLFLAVGLHLSLDTNSPSHTARRGVTFRCVVLDWAHFTTGKGFHIFFLRVSVLLAVLAICPTTCAAPQPPSRCGQCHISDIRYTY